MKLHNTKHETENRQKIRHNEKIDENTNRSNHHHYSTINLGSA